MKEISLLGCGWLGLPLARKLVGNGFAVKGSTTSEAKVELIREIGIVPHHIALKPDKINGEIADFLSSEILIIDVPPKTTEGNFAEKISTLVPYIEDSPITKVLFVSSISVYGENTGSIDENTIPKPDSENGLQLLEAEKLLLQNSNFETTILRFGGLIGNDRHPVKYLAGKQNSSGNARVNLIHLEDCIGVICRIISLGKWGETYNAVAPFHPTRAEYYTKKATEMGLALPTFSSAGNDGKVIRTDKIINDLGYLFERPFL